MATGIHLDRTVPKRRMQQSSGCARMSFSLRMGRSSRTLLAFLAALVLSLPPGLAGSLTRTSKASETAVQKSCCGGSRSEHDSCSAELPAAKAVVRSACCQQSAGSKPVSGFPTKSCCGGMGGCGCLCCPSIAIAIVLVRPFEWSTPVFEQACLCPSVVLSSRRDTPPTPPPNVA